MENERLNGKKTMGRMEGKEGIKDHRKMNDWMGEERDLVWLKWEGLKVN